MECFSSSNTLNLRLSSVGLGPYGYAYRPPAMLDPYNKRPRPLAAASLPLSLYRCSGRKNVLRKLLRILYRRLKAGFSVCCSTVCLFVTERVLTKAQFRRRASAVPNLILILCDCSTAGK